MSVGTCESRDSSIGGLQVINSSNGEGAGRAGTVSAILRGMVSGQMFYELKISKTYSASGLNRGDARTECRLQSEIGHAEI